MRARGGFAVLAGAWALSGGAVWAQQALPAEFPPPSFTGTQYVDSEGCAFIRAGISGNATFVPRLNRDREQLCGFAPTFAGGAPVAMSDPLAGVPNPLDAPLAGRPAVAPAPAPVVAEAPAPAPRRPAEAPRSPSPAVVAQAAPPAAPALAAPAPIRRTLAEACAGRTGVQPNIRDGRTGLAIDCGPGEVLASAAPSTTGPLRLTLSEVCARIARTGTQFVYSDTRAPVVCGPSAPIVVATAVPPAMPTVRPAAVPPALAPSAIVVAAQGGCGLGIVGGRSYLPSGPGTRCGPQAESPSGTIVVSAAVARAAMPEVTRAAASPGTAALPSMAAPVPASNPVGIVPQIVPTAPGYERVWDDGRVNPSRGVPQPISGSVLMGARLVSSADPVAPRVLARAVAPQAAPQSASVYVQVGAFGDPANAERAVATLAGMGLPVGIAQGRTTQAVAAGPFASAAEAQAALARARAAGYGDAFIR